MHRVVTPAAAGVWFPNGVLSSTAFSYPVFSADVASLSSVQETLARWPDGSGIVGFNSGQARQLGFDARHEPEHGNSSHANVYCTHPNNERKRRARQLAAMSVIVREPTPPVSG